MMPPITGTVRKVKQERREMLAKDGVTKRMQTISKIKVRDSEGDDIVLTSYDENFVLPKEGEKVSYPLRRYECFDGMDATGMI